MRQFIPLSLLCAVAAAGEPLTREDGLPSDDVLDLCASGPDRVWAATAGGLCRIEAYTVVRVPADGAPRLLAPAPEGTVFALFPDTILRVGDAVEETITLPLDPGVARVGAIRFDGALHVVQGGRGFVRGPDGWRPAPMPASVPRPVTVRGDIWRPTRGGGIERARTPPRFRTIALPGAQRVHALAMAPDGSVWCGTENGVVRVGAGAPEAHAAIDGQPLGTVTAVAVDAVGRVWIGSGSSFRGLFRREGDTWRRVDGIDGFVHRITRDNAGALWFAVLEEEQGEGRGAWVYSSGEFRRAPGSLDLPSERVYDVVARDPAGVLWFATLKGLASFDGGTVSPVAGLKGEKVWCLAAARDGSLWIGYQGERGVTRLARGRLEHFDVDDGLCDGNVWSVVEGEPGVFWFATAHGLSRFDGLRWSCFLSEPIWPLLPAPDGSLWIGTLGAGLIHCTPDDRDPPRTRFVAGAFAAPSGGSVTVTWRGTDAWFDTPARDLWYRWRLDGGRWSKASPHTSALVAAADGRHRFEVQAIDRFGNAEDPPARVEILVGPGAGRAPWLLVALLGVLLLLFGYLIGRRGRRTGSAARAT